MKRDPGPHIRQKFENKKKTKQKTINQNFIFLVINFNTQTTTDGKLNSRTLFTTPLCYRTVFGLIP